MPALESRGIRTDLGKLGDLSQARALLERLKWLRVTDVVWRDDILPALDLSSLGAVTHVTHGLALHLNGPVMQRGIRDATLAIVPGDLQSGPQPLVPVGYSPFLRCQTVDAPTAELPLVHDGGFTRIATPLAVGVRVRFDAVTPLWLSVLAWISVIATVGGGAWLFLPQVRPPVRA